MLSTVKKSQATMLAAWARRNSRQLGPDRRGAGSSLACASSGGCSSARRSGRAWPARRRSADGPSAGSRAQAAAPTPEPQPAAAADRADRAAVATSVVPARDATAAACAESQEAWYTTSVAGGRLRPQEVPDQPL